MHVISLQKRWKRPLIHLAREGKLTSQDTVPFCLWCAAHHLENYEAALWTTVTPQGDRDTNCAIVGGIVSLSARRVPAEWLARREPLPEDVRFEDYY